MKRRIHAPAAGENTTIVLARGSDHIADAPATEGAVAADGEYDRILLSGHHTQTIEIRLDPVE